MRILAITECVGGPSGSGAYSEELLYAFIQDGHEVAAIVSLEYKPLPYEQHALLETPYRYMANPLRVCLHARRVARVIRAYQPDVVHIFSEPYATMIPFLPRSVPTVLTVHGTYAYFPHLLQNPLQRVFAQFLTKLYVQNVRAIIAISEYTKKFMCTHLRGIEGKISVIPNGINEALIRVHETKPDGTLRILCVGGVKLRKGILEALDALAAYRSHYNDNFIFHAVGSLAYEPEYVLRVRARIEELGLTKQVVLTDIIDQPALDALYETASVYLMLLVTDGKEFDGFGLVYLEANARGVPTIGAKGSAAEESIQDGVSGYLVDPHSPNAVAHALARVSSERKALSEGALQWARAHTWRAISKQYVKLYTHVVTPHS